MPTLTQRVVLLVLDGFGIGRHDASNPIFVAAPPNLTAIRARYRAGALQASGIAVGLPWDEEGNSEVGHLTMGAGKVLYQHYPKITLAVRDGTFFKNPTLAAAFAHAKKTGGSVNLAGLLTAGNVHASLEHLEALIAAAKEHGIADVNLFLFTDGKDSPPKSAPALIEKVRGFIARYGLGAIAGISGRFYALDRDEHWDRTEKTYRMFTGNASLADDIGARIESYYARGLGDEYIEPFSVGQRARAVKDGDALIFFDFREDSVRQIAGSFILPAFDRFPRTAFTNLFVATMTRYREDFEVPVLFEADRTDAPLGKVLADAGAVQLRIAETEKYAHVTYFFNGYRDQPFAGEYRVLVPSKRVASADLAPEMMAREIGSRVAESVADRTFSFILANIANADLVAHTGNFDAAVKAVAVIDEVVGTIAHACAAADTALIITGDHGNVEVMIDPLTGRPETSHDISPVPLYLVGAGFENAKTIAQADAVESEVTGILSDIAPTILEIMGLPKPAEMTGESLVRRLR